MLPNMGFGGMEGSRVGRRVGVEVKVGVGVMVRVGGVVDGEEVWVA